MAISGSKLFITGLLSAVISVTAQATVVEVQTNLGDFEIHLYDHDPALKPTVTNFLNYMEGVEGYGSYQNTFVHRSIPGFIVQTGGFKLDDEGYSAEVQSAPPIQNAPVYSNVRGTVAMAKLGNNQHSATNQWFVNLSNNAGNLDKQNGGFTVFGEVTRGMDVVDAIAALPRYNVGLAFDNLPAQNVTPDSQITGDNLVVISNIVVTNSNPDSGAALSPIKSTSQSSDGGKSGGGGGALSTGTLGLLLGLFGLGLMGRSRR